jgi:hypothetical protein
MADTFFYISPEESIRLVLARKRRLRMIYKWRYGLPHSHQPAKRDRGKLRRLETWSAMRTINLPPELIALVGERVARAESITVGAVTHSLLVGV